MTEKDRSHYSYSLDQPNPIKFENYRQKFIIQNNITLIFCNIDHLLVSHHFISKQNFPQPITFAWFLGQSCFISRCGFHQCASNVRWYDNIICALRYSVFRPDAILLFCQVSIDIYLCNFRTISGIPDFLRERLHFTLHRNCSSRFEHPSRNSRVNEFPAIHLFASQFIILTLPQNNKQHQLTPISKNKHIPSLNPHIFIQRDARKLKRIWTTTHRRIKSFHIRVYKNSTGKILRSVWIRVKFVFKLNWTQ